MNEVFLFLDGRKFTHKGISGHLKHDRMWGIHPLRVTERLLFIPDVLGRQTQEYLDSKKKLGDDWISDLTDDIETYCSYALELGFVLAPVQEEL